MQMKQSLVHRVGRILAATTPLFLLAACASIDCSTTNTVSCRYALRGNVDTLSDTLTIITTRPDSNDCVVLNRLSNATAFTLPMSYGNDSDQLYFVLKDTLGTERTDTVTIFKTNDPHFESIDCQPRFFHTITAVQTTHNAIDSITIANSNVNFDEKENLLIYFHSRP